MSDAGASDVGVGGTDADVGEPGGEAGGATGVFVNSRSWLFR